MAEARDLARLLVEIECARCGGDVELAIHHCATRYGLDEGSLRSLRYRWRDLADVRGSVLERLRMAYEHVYERQRRETQIAHEINTAMGREEFELEPAE